MTRLTPIHHAMARAMPVSGGCPVRVGDSIASPWDPHDDVGAKVVSVRYDGRRWRWQAEGFPDWLHLLVNDRILPAPRVPPSGGRGRVSR